MSPKRPDPAELRQVAVQADMATIDLARAVGAAASAGITIDDEVTIAVTTLTSWAAWLGRRAIGDARNQGTASNARR